AFTPANSACSVSGVTLANGINIISARAKTSSARIATTSVRVKYFGNAPQIAITSPIAGTQTGAASVDVSGTYVNVDPSTISVNGATPSIKSQSDTTGTFAIASVALAPNAKTTITATGRSRAGATATATTDVTNSGAASITIASPLDNTFIASAASTLHVTGTFAPVTGSQVQVNGAAAALDASGNFAADVDLSTSTTSSIPVVARVTTAAGKSATDAVRVIRFGGALAVTDSFPSQNAV